MSSFKVLLLIISIFLAAEPALAEIYMYKDSAGHILLTDRPRKGLELASIEPDSKNFKAQTYKTKKSSSKSNIQYFTRYHSIIKKASAKHKLDHKLVSAVIQIESQFNPKAVSHAGAIGLMQLMPTTAEQLGVINPYDPSDNINGGAKYLRYLIERFDGDITLALAAYNCGPLRVEKLGRVPNIKETKRYIKKIYSLYKGAKKINLSKSGGKTIRRIKMNDGTIVYTNYLSDGSERF